MRAFLLLLSLILGFSEFAFADFSGRIHLEENSFYEAQVAPIEHFQDNAFFEFESKNKINDWLRITIEPRIQTSSAQKIVDSSVDFNTRDTLVEFKIDSFHIQLGSFVKQWEGPDGFNPMDIGTVKNYRDPLNTESLASAGINLSFGGKRLGWDAFYVPLQTPSRLPGANSRWLPRKTPFPLISGLNTLVLPSQPELQVLDHQEINSALKNNFGLRLQYHGDSWDISLATFSGAAQLPFFRVRIVGDLVSTLPDGSTVIQLRNPIQLEPVEFYRQSYAAGFVSTLSDTWIFRLSGRFDQPVGSDPQLPGPSDQFVGGFEKTLTVSEQTLTLSLQYAFGQTLESPSGVLTITDPFKNAILYGVRYPIRESLTLYYGGCWSHLINATYNRFRIEKKINDSFSFDVGADLIRGPPENLLGVWSAQSRANIGLTYLW